MLLRCAIVLALYWCQAIDGKALEKRQAPWQPSRTIVGPATQMQRQSQQPVVYPYNNRQQNNRVVVPQFQPQQFQYQNQNQRHQYPNQNQNQNQYRPLQPVQQRPGGFQQGQVRPVGGQQVLPGQQPPSISPGGQPLDPNQPFQITDNAKLNAEYERIWNQMVQLWEQMTQRFQTSGLEGDWNNFWTKLTSTVEPYMKQFSQQFTQLMNVAVRQQQQEALQQAEIVQQVQNGLNQIFNGQDGNPQQAIKRVVDSFFNTDPQAQQQGPRPTNVGK